MVSISGRQQQLTNTTKARFLERAFCYLPVLYALAPSARRRAARKPQAKSGVVLLGRGAAASLALNPLYLTGGWNYNMKLQKTKTPCRKPRNQRFGSVRNFRFRVFDIEKERFIMNSTISEYIKTSRLELGLTQDELAQRAGISVR